MSMLLAPVLGAPTVLEIRQSSAIPPPDTTYVPMEIPPSPAYQSDYAHFTELLAFAGSDTSVKSALEANFVDLFDNALILVATTNTVIVQTNAEGVYPSFYVKAIAKPVTDGIFEQWAEYAAKLAPPSYAEGMASTTFTQLQNTNTIESCGAVFDNSENILFVFLLKMGWENGPYVFRSSGDEASEKIDACYNAYLSSDS